MTELQTVFGLHAVSALLEKDPEKIKRLLVLRGRKDKRLESLLVAARKAGVSIENIERHQLDKIVAGNHQGVIAECDSIAEMDEGDLETLLQALTEKPFLLVLDGVTDPHNLGACLRSADAAGVHAVIAPKDKSAPLNGVARKVACGAAEHVPYIKVTNLARTLKWLKQYGIWLVGAAGETEQTIYENDFNGAIALIMGAEGKGLRRLTKEHCDGLVKIPMAGSVSSLNVSVATGICLFEAVRQRRL
ncbi:23S rRNA (guanosine(2251)-2'-O)-methyltransferase RlmB [Alkalimarinus alittae]|uniref:23S rRNA (guanosine-2'-O-)-methyltransferase RlmB n=1 Tax=Alkalimarinus alittae TaxID=2961619 RepID=A0ABY6N4C8_9ALTE|nr:23S rRNA (guanosine(2251)-2'-O)-methyltransferase RlmB [Alkalimarinus alittae]UZE96895.1 23S rRNA (guanosine(2251)-2'-O)-methyltransferase RlmB [Alkalimarinus alittae]